MTISQADALNIMIITVAYCLAACAIRYRVSPPRSYAQIGAALLIPTLCLVIASRLNATWPSFEASGDVRAYTNYVFRHATWHLFMFIGGTFLGLAVLAHWANRTKPLQFPIALNALALPILLPALTQVFPRDIPRRLADFETDMAQEVLYNIIILSAALFAFFTILCVLILTSLFGQRRTQAPET